MNILNLSPNIGDADAFYARLISIHDGLSEDESAALNARLILILANQIGDDDILEQAMSLARTPGG